MDDAELVRSASGGDKQAFASIYERYSRPLYDFLCSLVRDRVEAADVLHETFMVSGARLGQLRDPSKLRAWLFAIARHEAMRALKGRSRLQPFDEDQQVISAEPEPSQVAAQSELVELVWAAAGGLNPRDRAILDLHLRQGLEGQELGDVLGVSASHAYVMLNRLKQQVERSLGALLVTRLGRKDCPQLSAILQGWDGRFTSQIRKRVVRHVDECVKCGEVRRGAVSPLSLLSAMPLIPLPEELGKRVLEDVRLVGHKQRPWPTSRGGFPPPITGDRKSRKAPWAAAAALFAVIAFLIPGAAAPLTGMIGFESNQTDSKPPVPQPIGEKASPKPSFSSLAPLTIEPVEQNAQSPQAGVLPAAPGEGAPQDPPVAGAGSSDPVSGPAEVGSPAGSAEQAEAGAGEAVPSLRPAPAPDATSPAISALRVSPTTIWAGGGCAAPGEPTTLSVGVRASDPSGISSVTLEWAGPAPGTVTMAKSGDMYVATVGPFSERTIRRNSSITIPLKATAADSAGNTAASEGSFVLRC